MASESPSLDSIFCTAIAIASAEDRAAYIVRACGSDPELRGQVEKLVRAHFRAGSFLEQPAAEAGATGDEVAPGRWIDPADLPPPSEGPGTRIGPYKLMEQIGEGGMGLVFVAEQHEPVKRRVALKVIKPGMDSRSVIARFEAERQALAMMDHANIAKVYDGGATAEGRPYFVMELVKGTPITDYCDAHRLSTRQRLELFLDVCQAVQHAHQKGIIHRDLKPSNVLVSLHDVTAVVKVIDFGVAKAIGGRLTDKTVYTQLTQLIGTPLYMSPEQAGLSDSDVDTRSDVYSLGVLLYELLTGTTPFEKERFKDAGYDEMRRMIREDEPPRPSARLSTLQRAALSTIAERRGLEPRRLSQQLRGELDWIVMKALEKDRSRRYESASALAADVQRYLDDEPVQACPPSKTYRLGKLVRRHKAGLGLAACLLLALMLAGYVAWTRHDRALQSAGLELVIKAALEESGSLQEQRRLSEALSAARRADGLLAGADVDEALRQRVRARRADLELLDKLENVRLEKMTAVKNGHFDWEGADGLFGQRFRDAGLDVEALPAEEAGARIGRSTVAAELAAVLDHWALTRQRIKGADDPSWKTLLRVARLADPDAWRTRVREALERRDRQALLGVATLEEVFDLPTVTLSVLGSAFLVDKEARGPAEVFLREAQRRHPNDFWLNYNLLRFFRDMQPPRVEEAYLFAAVTVALRPDSPGAHLNLGMLLRDQKCDYDGAIAEYREAIRLKKDYAEAHHNLGYALYLRGRLDEAIAEYREAIRLKKDDAQAQLNLGIALSAKGRLDEAIAEYREAIRINKDHLGAHLNLGALLCDQKRDYDGAIAEFREAIRINKDYADAYYNLGNALAKKGRLDEAIAEYHEAIRLKKDYADAYYNLGNALAKKGRLDEAIAEFREAIRLKKDYADAYYNLGNALAKKGRLDEAIAEYREAIRLKKDDAEAHHNLGYALYLRGRLDEAIAEYREAIRLKKDDAEAHSNLGIALLAKGQVDGAIAEFREALRINKDLPKPHYNLGNALYAKDLLDEGIAEFREAIRIKKDYAEAHSNLGTALTDKGQLDEAIAEYREAIRLDNNAGNHCNLGTALTDKGQLDEAIAEYREALRINKDHPGTHISLGALLCDKKRDYDGAIAEFREAIRLQKDEAKAHHNLGVALKHKGQLDEAIAEFREAIRLKKDFAEAHCYLGDVLEQKGQFAEALVYLRRGHELGSKKPRWPYPSAQWARNCERLVELDGKLPAILSGQRQPADTAERLMLAWMCQRHQHRHAAAVRFYREAFDAEPKAAGHLNAHHRYNAACSAALAGCGQGKDADKLDEKERARLRQQALDWLRADLKAYRQVMEKVADKAGPAIAQQMRHWLHDADFAGVRGAVALARLPEAERADWRQLWQEVEALRQRAAQRSAPASTARP
jgi:tetratricopeptide (TPR) repeat protein/tRNA A-37 threonylcarbamoyl transferase component Bud32